MQQKAGREQTEERRTAARRRLGPRAQRDCTRDNRPKPPRKGTGSGGRGAARRPCNYKDTREWLEVKHRERPANTSKKGPVMI